MNILYSRKRKWQNIQNKHTHTPTTNNNTTRTTNNNNTTTSYSNSTTYRGETVFPASDDGPTEFDAGNFPISTFAQNHIHLHNSYNPSIRIYIHSTNTLHNIYMYTHHTQHTTLTTHHTHTHAYIPLSYWWSW